MRDSRRRVAEFWLIKILVFKSRFSPVVVDFCRHHANPNAAAEHAISTSVKPNVSKLSEVSRAPKPRAEYTHTIATT